MTYSFIVLAGQSRITQHTLQHDLNNNSRYLDTVLFETESRELACEAQRLMINALAGSDHRRKSAPRFNADAGSYTSPVPVVGAPNPQVGAQIAAFAAAADDAASAGRRAAAAATAPSGPSPICRYPRGSPEFVRWNAEHQVAPETVAKLPDLAHNVQ